MPATPLEQLKARIASLDAREIDELYGLEPVFEPGASGGEAGAGALGEFVELQCPWCGEVYGTHVDLTDHSRAWIEDCQVCCQPIDVSLEVGDRGELVAVSAARCE
jgi:hypothetical protein